MGRKSDRREPARVVAISIAALFFTSCVGAPLPPTHVTPAQSGWSTSCSDGWRVTGYYTPREEEFTGPSTQIDVPGHGFVKFPLDFVRHVQVEGWGLTRYGWYLGWEQGWTKDDAPRDSRGERLRNGSLAVDPSVIPFGTRVQIPNLPPPWDEQSFIAADTGGAIEGKHVDVYCGAGPAALREAIRITANNRRVCSS